MYYFDWLNSSWRNKPIPNELQGIYDDEKYEKQQIEMGQKREEYENAFRHSHKMAERERVESEYVKRKNNELIKNLQEQIEDNTKRRMSLEKEKYQEGSVMKQHLVSQY